MNILIIPSWYPSSDHPYTGLFFRKEAELYARHFPNDNIGIFTWGQNDEKYLLYLSNPISGISKFLTYKGNRTDFQITDNCIEFHTSALTWTRKLFFGNIKGIVQANRYNLSRFESRFGRPDIIHAHVGYPGGYIAYLLSEEYQIPYLITENQSPFPFRTFLNRSDELTSLLKKAYEHSMANVAVSETMQRKMKGFRLPNIRLVSNYVDESAFKPEDTIQKENDFLFVGRLEPQKGPDVLLNALEITKTKNVRVKVIGDGSMYKELLERANSQERHCITFIGERDQKAIITELQRSHAFILPSRHEGLPFAIIEALACGLPVITTNCGGPEEMINPEVGLVVEKENPKELSDAIDKLVNKRNDYSSEKIRRHFIENYSSKTVTNKLRATYVEIAATYK